jgi:antitoxin (DNA-binding transcriptional repressor) of toxin-antitoxin stability system
MSAPNHELTAAVARELKRATRGGHLILTRGGRPIAYILPTSIYDEEDIGYMTDPEFWKMIRERRAEPTVPLETVLRDLHLKEAAERAKPRKRAGAKGKKDHATA